MRIPASRAALTLTMLALVAGYVDEAPGPVEVETFELPVYHAPAVDADQFRTHARGREEVPPVDTRAQGQAVFRLSDDGEELAYKLIVANIENVLMAHIHQAPRGVNGPVVVWLYPPAPPPQLIEGRTQGVLAEGVLTADDLVGPLEGENLSALVDVLRAGNGYVNVHTTQNPAGEVRGQIH
jgi:hypothetical protein